MNQNNFVIEKLLIRANSLAITPLIIKATSTQKFAKASEHS